MTYGLRIVGDHGATQIDSEHRNHQLVGAGTISHASMSAAPGSLARYYDLSVVGLTSPLIAFSCAGAPVYYYEFGTNYRFVKATHTGTTTDAIHYWIFDMVDDLADPTGYGVVIYDAVGNIAFDASRKSLSIIEFIEEDDPGAWNSSDGGASSDVVYPAGRSYAVVPCKLGFNHIHQELGVGASFDVLHAKLVTGVRQIDNICRLQWVGEHMAILDNSTPAPFSEDFMSALSDWLVIDVSGF